MSYVHVHTSKGLELTYMNIHVHEQLSSIVHVYVYRTYRHVGIIHGINYNLDMGLINVHVQYLERTLTVAK